MKRKISEHPDRSDSQIEPACALVLEGLNSAQCAAVCHTEGPLLVLAGAGSGKTRVITRRIAHIIGKGLASPGEILGVTFTNKAASEMRERVAGRIGSKAARAVVLSTFHAFCLRVLRAHIDALGYRRDFTISDEGDIRTVLRRILGDIEGPKESFSPQLLQAAISLRKNQDGGAPPVETARSGKPAARKRPSGKKAVAPPTETDLKYETWVPEIFERYQSALRAANTLDFDDLLVLTVDLWRRAPEILDAFRNKFKYIMVDEYQDTNPIQYELLRHLAGARRNVCVVGDDDQSIYGWRGADMRKILNFERDFPGARIITLDRNYRSTETILDAANAVIVHNEHRRAKDLWSDLGRGAAIDWVVTGDDEHEAETAAAWLEFIRGKAGAAYGDFAVLYRSSIQSRPFELAFRGKGIPYTVSGGQDFFERSEVKDLLAYLKVIANPRHEAAFLRVVNMPRRGVGDAALHRIHEICLQESLPLGKGAVEALRRGLVSDSAAHGLRQFFGLLQRFRDRFRARETPLSLLISDLVDAIAYRQEVFRASKSEAQFHLRWGNVEAVLNAVAAYEANAPTPSLSGFLDDNALDGDDDRRAKESRCEDAVALMTIHSAKGLEFPFVFIAGCEEGLLPHEKSLRDDALEEERRLFYVALTRAKRHVTLFEALRRNRRGRERDTQTSRFLKEIPESLLRKHVRADDNGTPETPKPNKASRSRRSAR